ncbi:E3 ubiquitin-protein ligase KCMF1 [Drosophila kikkawai]|uniref:RING-type E3 ubiquitin transferase n=1 Tax=Drosophila kikkawai TaxID=30033 RepID=A0A6P4ID80_DROKI|nr:uncharacterized protein LOC108077415 [Drosophila kikkawai]
MNRHEGVVCSGCGKVEFTGRCYRCLSCRDLAICADCYDIDFTTADHPFDHPVKCVYTPSDVELYFGGEYITSDPPQSYRCPYCKQWGFNESTFLEHVSAQHPGASPLLVSTMITLFEQQQAARLFLEDEQLASISAAAVSRNEQMRRSVGSLDLFLEQLNPDGSYLRAGQSVGTQAVRGNEVARERSNRLRRSAGPPASRGRPHSIPLIRAALPPPASGTNPSIPPAISISSPNSSSLGSETSNRRQEVMAPRYIITESGHSRLNFVVAGMEVPTTLRAAAQQVVASSAQPSTSTASSPLITHPTMTEMMRFYGGNLSMPHEMNPPASRANRSRQRSVPWLQPAGADPSASTAGTGRGVNIFGPVSHLNQSPNLANSIHMTPSSRHPRETRHRTSRMLPNVPGNNSGGLSLQLLAPSTHSRTLAVRSVNFSDQRMEDSEMLNLNLSSTETALRSLNIKPATEAKESDKERERFLCYRFLKSSPSQPADEQAAFLEQRAEFVAQLISSALCDDELQESLSSELTLKLPTISSSDKAGAGDAEKIPPL